MTLCWLPHTFVSNCDSCRVPARPSPLKVITAQPACYIRHFADEVHNGIHAGLDLTAAIEAAINRWMGWTINRETAREIAMPKGLPYLKGFVLYFSLQAQEA